MPTPDDAATNATAETFEATARARVSELADDIDLGTFAAAFNLFRAASQLVQDLEPQVHRPLGLSIAGFRILFTVWTLGELQPRQLARLAGVSRAAISGALKTLERDGLVERHRDDLDGRLVNVRLTPLGATTVETAYIEQNRRERLLFESLDHDELEALASMIRRVLASPVIANDNAAS
ncbi:MAG: MarR family transcriptional regulator [Acidimicrobiales bacterium]